MLQDHVHRTPGVGARQHSTMVHLSCATSTTGFTNALGVWGPTPTGAKQKMDQRAHALGFFLTMSRV